MDEDLHDLAIDAQDRVYVAGCSTKYGDDDPFPVTEGAFDVDPGLTEQKKAIIARLDNNLTKVEAAT